MIKLIYLINSTICLLNLSLICENQKSEHKPKFGQGWQKDKKGL